MVFGLGVLSGLYHKGSLQPALPKTTPLSSGETESVTAAIVSSIETTRRVVRGRWASGDLLIVDNLSVAHLASDGTQAPPEEAGLRLMQRTTVQNFRVPQKRPVLHDLKHECVVDGDVS